MEDGIVFRRRLASALAGLVLVGSMAAPAAVSATGPITDTSSYGAQRGEYIRRVYKDGSVTYEHDPFVTFFVTGREDFHGDTDPVSEDYRSFFVFDVGPTNAHITKAALRIGVPSLSYV